MHGLCADEEAAAELDPDHKLLLRCVLPLLKSRNSGVVLGVASIYQYLSAGGGVEDNLIGKALVHVMRNHREVEFVVLSNIASIAATNPGMFRKYLKDFYVGVRCVPLRPARCVAALECLSCCCRLLFVQDTEPGFIRKQKMEVLALLVSGENSGLIMKEFTRYVADSDPGFVVASVLAVGRIADAMPDLAPRVLGGLMGLINHPHEGVVAASVVVIRQLLQRHPANEVLPACAAAPVAFSCARVTSRWCCVAWCGVAWGAGDCEAACSPFAGDQDPRSPCRHRVDPRRVSRP